MPVYEVQGCWAGAGNHYNTISAKRIQIHYRIGLIDLNITKLFSTDQTRFSHIQAVLFL